MAGSAAMWRGLHGIHRASQVLGAGDPGWPASLPEGAEALCSPGSAPTGAQAERDAQGRASTCHTLVSLFLSWHQVSHDLGVRPHGRRHCRARAELRIHFLAKAKACPTDRQTDRQIAGW